MKLSASNIAWPAEKSAEIYAILKENGFSGLEIAPTMLFTEPYDHLAQAQALQEELLRVYGLQISSMQSIWYGMTESIFGSAEDREKLLAYTRKAIDFASAVGCKNLVFGCPRNRVIPGDEALPVAYAFFREMGDYAQAKHTCIGLEANPPYYHTNFINTTAQAFEFCRKVGSEGLRVTVDLGTCIHYGEGIELLADNIGLVNHIHISEPMLVPIAPRELHAQLKQLPYAGYASIEMRNTGHLEDIQAAIRYVGEALL